MKFTASTKSLLKVIEKANSIISTRVIANSVLSYLLLDVQGNELSVSGTNFDTTITSIVGVGAVREGKILVQARILLDTLKALQGGKEDSIITIDVQRKLVSKNSTEEKITILFTTIHGEYKTQGKDAGEFPMFATQPKKFSFQLPLRTFEQMFNAVTYCCGNDDFRPALMGVFLQCQAEALTCVATDTYKLTEVQYQGTFTLPENQTEVSCVIPRSVTSIKKYFGTSDDLTLTLFGDEEAKFLELTDGTTTVYTKLVDEEYPVYRSILPRTEEQIGVMRVGRELLLRTLRRVAIMANAKTHYVQFDVLPSSLTIQTQDIDTGCEAKEEIPVDFRSLNAFAIPSNGISRGFNADFLSGLLQAMEGYEEIEMYFQDKETRPMLLSPVTTEGSPTSTSVRSILVPMKFQ